MYRDWEIIGVFIDYGFSVVYKLEIMIVGVVSIIYFVFYVLVFIFRIFIVELEEGKYFGIKCRKYK